MNDLQAYLVHEYVADYKAGHLSRRDLVRRVLNVTGGIGSTATMLLVLGCAPSPAAQPTAAVTAAAAKPTTAPASPASSPSPAVAQPAASPSPGASPSPAASPVAKPAASPGASPSPVSQSPLSVPANDPAIEAQDITFPGAGGATIMAYQARPRTASGALPLVLVCHENRGLTEHIRDVTRRFAKEGYVACAVDLVSRQGGTAAITDPNQFSAVFGQATPPDQFVGDFRSAVEYYKTQPNLAQANRIAMNGFCFGGVVTWRSVTAIADIRAAAPYYGARPPADQVPNIKAAVLGVYSSDPMDFANNGRQDLESQLTAAGVDHKFNEYPGTRHGFNNDTGQAYNQEQSIAAWRDTLAWFKEKLA
jgi:carboxymethylenebutenolidase